MKTTRLFGIAVLLVSLAASSARAVSPTAVELKSSRDWAAARFQLGNESSEIAPCFSFNYGGKPSSELLKTWDWKRSSRKLDEHRAQFTLVGTDPKTGLELRCVGVEYLDFPTVEWTLYFKNTSDNETPILSDIQPLDETLKHDADGEFTLHRTVGDGVPEMYRPDPIVLGPSQEKTIAPFGGRPSSNEFPYFNVEMPGGGMLFAIGWPGQWSAKFTRDAGKSLRITAGQELTHFKLLPGEEVRSPLIVVQFYEGSPGRAQNLWRRWMLAYNTPHPNGKLPETRMNLATSNSHGYFGITEANQKQWFDRYEEEKFKLDYMWVDLCWFKMDGGTLIYNGLYDSDPVRFPNGLKAVSDHVHAKGAKLIAWFEPEHLYPGPENWHVQNHPEWLLKAPPGHEAEVNQLMPLKDRMVYNLGNPDALQWLIDNTTSVIRREKIDLYRHDFNVEPLIFWRAADAEDRQGVTEIKYVTGFLAYYDALLNNFPGMQIDNCASGGRRNDVETLRRSVPLLRSDTWGEPVGQQCQTYGLANWIPYWGTGIMYSDPKDLAYIFRSQMGPSFTSCWDLTAKADYSLHRKLIDQWRSVRQMVLEGDFYPLTPYTAANDVWMAWQFDCPEKGEGLVQVFRRAGNAEESKTLKLQGLDAAATYVVINLDTEQRSDVAGRELMDTGLPVILREIPDSAVITYQKKSK
jgi:alpha-galactosidase